MWAETLSPLHHKVLGSKTGSTRGSGSNKKTSTQVGAKQNQKHTRVKLNSPYSTKKYCHIKSIRALWEIKFLYCALKEQFKCVFFFENILNVHAVKLNYKKNTRILHFHQFNFNFKY